MTDKKFHVTGWIQVSINIDQIVEAENEENAKRMIWDNSEWDVNNLELEAEEVSEHDC